MVCWEKVVQTFELFCTFQKLPKVNNKFAQSGHPVIGSDSVGGKKRKKSAFAETSVM
jgi:hypothetical protein